MVRADIHPFDIEELACYVTGLDYDEIDANTDIINEALYGKFGFYLEEFKHLVDILIPLIDVGSSPLTGERFKGFAKDGVWLVKFKI